MFSPNGRWIAYSSPDGQRFVMIEEGESQPALTQLILVQNWGEELKRLVPTN